MRGAITGGGHTEFQLGTCCALIILAITHSLPATRGQLRLSGLCEDVTRSRIGQIHFEASALDSVIQALLRTLFVGLAFVLPVAGSISVPAVLC